MPYHESLEKPGRGPYEPLVILHGGAGSITRAGLPPALYQLYHSSLKSYLESTQALLEGKHNACSDNASAHHAANAVDAAVHAVSLFEDDPLFNCGHGAVFTTSGEIQMEASLAVSCIHESMSRHVPGHIKKSAAVSMIAQTRHPVQLAKLVLETADGDDVNAASSVRDMHGHLSGEWVEQLGFSRGLEKKPRSWFWTRKRWDEHRRGLGLTHTDEEWKQKLDEDVEDGDQASSRSFQGTAQSPRNSNRPREPLNLIERAISQYHDLPSQGTVGAVCMDSWGNLAVATSTGGLTNKRPGRIGDTPTVGAGFWAESWNEDVSSIELNQTRRHKLISSNLFDKLYSSITGELSSSWLRDCLSLPMSPLYHQPQSPACLSGQNYKYTHNEKQNPTHHDSPSPTTQLRSKHSTPPPQSYTSPTPPSSFYQANNKPQPQLPRRAIALSGTGNGDSFLRTALARTTASMLHFGNNNTSVSPFSSFPPSSFPSSSTSPSTTPSQHQLTLQNAVTLSAGPDGLLQRSAEDRWGISSGGGEGEGGMIGIEAVYIPASSLYSASSPSGVDGGRYHDERNDYEEEEEQEEMGKVEASVVFDFNCGGMWRAWFVDADDDGDGGGKKKRERTAKVMVFREEY